MSEKANKEPRPSEMEGVLSCNKQTPLIQIPFEPIPVPLTRHLPAKQFEKHFLEDAVIGRHQRYGVSNVILHFPPSFKCFTLFKNDSKSGSLND